MTSFEKHYQADGSCRWWQEAHQRYVDAGQYQLLEWLAGGGIPDEVAYVPPAKPAMEISAPMELDRPDTAADLAALTARVARLEKAAGLGTDKTDEKDETAVAPPPAPSDLSVSSVASVSSVLPRAEATTP